MQRVWYLSAALAGLMLVGPFAVPARADDAQPAGLAAFDETAAVPTGELVELVGGSQTINLGDVMMNGAELGSTISGNVASNLTSGVIGTNTIANNTGMNAVVFNTGSFVNVQTSFQININVGNGR